MTARRLEGKRVLILGGGTGLGRACAEAMLAEGAGVFLSGRRAGMLAQAAAALAGRGPVAHGAGDATREDDVRRVVEAADVALGGLDTLVVSAGLSAVGSILDTTLEDFRRVSDANLLPLFLGAKHAAPHIIATGGGAIIAIASTTGVVAMRERVAYAAAKAGVIGMVRAIALDLADRGVRVNAISPSLVMTDLARAVLAREKDPEAVLARRTAQHPLGRLGTPEEVAEVAVYLASDRAGWTTGQNFVIDGGLTIA
ncbi:MAG: SDR family oxidoreductase [Rhodospirillaceae bacterium]|nr:SDR family oxidoreductase [Rhodospirillaceae bacterium]